MTATVQPADSVLRLEATVYISMPPPKREGNLPIQFAPLLSNVAHGHLNQGIQGNLLMSLG